MRLLTESEIKFVKETNFTPAVYQCGDYFKTPYKDFSDACKHAKRDYDINLCDFINKNIGAELNDEDFISLENTAVYLLYAFFTKEDLEDMHPAWALNWLQNYRYFCGFRKWTKEDADNAINEALGIYYGSNILYEEDDKNISYKSAIVEGDLQ